MPYKNGKEMTADAAHAAGFCPECARDYAEVNAEEHIAAHWPRPGEASDEAKRRMKLIRDAQRGGKTFDKPEPPAAAPAPAAKEGA